MASIFSKNKIGPEINSRALHIIVSEAQKSPTEIHMNEITKIPTQLKTFVQIGIT